MRVAFGSPRELVKELPWLGATAAALLAIFAFEHFVVHELIVLPALAELGVVPLWMIATMVVPELVVFFAVGYRLRSVLAAVMHAGVGALLRSGFHLTLAVVGRPGHTATSLLSASELTLATPVMAVAYLVVAALAATAASEQRQLVGDR